MRIAFLCFEAFHRGGIKTYTRELLNGIAAAGHDVVLFSPPPPPGAATGLGASVQVQQVNVANLPMTSALTYWYDMPRVFRRTEERIERFDIVHSNVYADLLLTKRATAGVRVVTAHHLGSTAAAAAGLRLTARLFKLSSEFGPAVIAEGVCLKRADHIIAVSAFTRNDVLKRYPELPPDRVSVAYLGTRSSTIPIAEQEVTALKSRWQIPDGDRIALAVGRLEDRKGIPLLLQALARTESPPDLKLVLVGSGKADPYDRIARKLGIEERVIFAGYLDDRTLSVAYRAANLYVHAASLEGFGLSIADAVAAGLPVVAVRAGSVPEVVRDGVDGVLVENGDAAAFAEAITAVLGERPDSGMHREAAPERFSWDKTVSETLRLYEKLLQS